MSEKLTYSGVVQPHSGRGHGLGYPTANFTVKTVLPAGIFAGYVFYHGKRYPAAIFCGTAEMFGETEPQLEAHILDFSGDLYGKTIKVELVQKIRDVSRFDTKAELITQIAQDIKVVRTCLQA